MKLIAGSYTSLGGPGLALLEIRGDRLQILDANGIVPETIWIEKSKKAPVVYAAGAQADGIHTCVAAYRYSDDKLTLLSRREGPGIECCHLCLDAAENYLYAANYGDGSVNVYPLGSDGQMGPCIQQVERKTALGPRKDRQERNHAHQVLFRPGMKELFVCDLGADQVVVYLAGSDGRLTLSAEIPCMPGSGPRHLSFDGADGFYLVGELDSSVSRFEWDGSQWKCVQHLSALPKGRQAAQNTAAAIRQDENHVYVSNRGEDCIAVFAKQANGWLMAPYFIRTPGTCPRDFLLMGSGFVLAHQQSGTVTCINENGVPTAQLALPGAVSLLTVD